MSTNSWLVVRIGGVKIGIIWFGFYDDSLVYFLEKEIKPFIFVVFHFFGTKMWIRY